MDVSVLNVVACNAASVGDTKDLFGVGFRWKTPPAEFAVWVEISNPTERTFTINLEIYRGREFLGESGEELVLAGGSYWQGVYAWRGASGFHAKSYNVTVVIDGAPVRTQPLDFGHPDGK